MCYPATENYLRLREALEQDDTYVMPVIQGYQPQEYARHVQALSPNLEAAA